MAESEQIWWAYVKIENVAEIYSARIYSSLENIFKLRGPADLKAVTKLCVTACKLTRR